MSLVLSGATVLAWAILGATVAAARQPALSLTAAPYAVMPFGSNYIDAWWPDLTSANWTYVWSDTAYNPAPGIVENSQVTSSTGTGSVFNWSGLPVGIPPTDTSAIDDQGTLYLQYTDGGITNTDWQGLPPLSGEPSLCASAANCANSLSGVFYNVIWGSRSPVLAEPLLQGTSWTSTGGAGNDVLSQNDYLGQVPVSVPAFPSPVMAAVVRSQITQETPGAPGAQYGSGIRTVWWVYGVGPVRIVFDHEGGSTAPVTTATLTASNLTPLAPPADANYFPLNTAGGGLYRWTNSRYLKQPEVERLKVASTGNGTGVVTAKSVSGPLKVSGSYGFTVRLGEGVANLYSRSSATSLIKFPKLRHGLHFFTPVDLMVYGFNPLLTAYPQAGASWTSGDARDMAAYGVTGNSQIVGIQTVHVPAGTFRALLVRSHLTQSGSRYGTGTRLMWFAAGRGLVKLQFSHADRSVTLVELTK